MNIENKVKSTYKVLDMIDDNVEIDECFDSLVQKNEQLNDVNELIKKYLIKDKIRMVSNYLLFSFVCGVLFVPNVLMIPAISFGFLKLFLCKYVGFKRSNRQRLKMLSLKKINFEIEIDNLITEIVDLKEEIFIKELFVDKNVVNLFDEKRDSNFNFYSLDRSNDEENDLQFSDGRKDRKVLKRERKFKR